MRTYISKLLKEAAKGVGLNYYDGTIDNIAVVKPKYPCLWVNPVKLVTDSVDTRDLTMSEMKYNAKMWIIHSKGNTTSAADKIAGWDAMEKAVLNIFRNVKKESDDAMLIVPASIDTFELPMTNAVEWGVQIEANIYTDGCTSTAG